MDFINRLFASDKKADVKSAGIFALRSLRCLHQGQYEAPAVLLMRIGTRMATGFDQHFAELGITQAQFRILLAVWEQGGAAGIAPYKSRN